MSGTTIRGGVIPAHILRLMPKEDREPLGKAGWTPEECNTKADAKLEREIQNKIAGLLSIRDIEFGRQRMDKKSTMVEGWPDFVFAIAGTPIAFEVKTATGKQTEEQKKVQARMERNGWKYYLVRSVKEAKEIVDHYKQAAAIQLGQNHPPIQDPV